MLLYFILRTSKTVILGLPIQTQELPFLFFRLKKMQWDVNMHVNMCNNKYKIKSIFINSCKYIWNIMNQMIYLSLHI